MLDTPVITETPAQLTAVIHITVPKEQIREVMGPGISEVFQTVAAQGIAPAGPWFTHHLQMLPDTFDFEVGVPVVSPVTPAGRVRPGNRPAMKVARAVHCGDYEQLGASWERFDAWMREQGLATSQDMWESYAVGPESTPDPEQWRTEFAKPLAE